MKKIFLLISILSSLAFSKVYPTGLLIDDNAYDSIPLTATLTRGAMNLPLLFSLETYTPNVGNQGQTGTCVAWATAYGARTILEAIANNRTNKITNTQNVFSPSYIYNQIRLKAGCQGGSYIEDALKLITNEGVVKFNNFGFDCNRQVTYKEKKLASKYKIQGYKKLFQRNSSNKIYPIKEALTEKKPVLISMQIVESFFEDNEIVWQPKSYHEKEFGFHAMVVVGYNDTIAGGSFRLMNSWDKRWGENGFKWIRYSDFQHFVREAYELIPKPNPQEAVKMGGEIEFINTQTKAIMNATYSYNKNIYVMNNPYRSGTRFNFTINNQEPIYLYAFGFDGKQIDILFPHNSRVSPYQGYKNSTISYPDEFNDIRLDTKQGTDYFVMLYSKLPLNLDKIKRLLVNQQGNIPSRLRNVLGDRLIGKDINFDKHRINFSYQGYKPLGLTSKDSVVSVVIEFNHI